MHLNKRRVEQRHLLSKLSASGCQLSARDESVKSVPEIRNVER
jgi:hypothetical protein